MADFRFGDCLRSGPGASQAASPSAESFSTASGGDGTSVTGKSYPVSLINVDEKCLRLTGRDKTSICNRITPSEDCKSSLESYPLISTSFRLDETDKGH